MIDDAVNTEIMQAEPPIAFGERLTCSVAEACKAVGISRSKFYELISGGEVQSVKACRNVYRGPAYI